MKSTIFKTTLASMALISSLTASAQITSCTYGQDNPYMVIQRNVLAESPNSDITMNDTTTPLKHIPTFQFNIYYGGDFSKNSDEGKIGLLICDNHPNDAYAFVDESQLIDLSGEIKYYVTQTDSITNCEIRSCRYDSTTNCIESIVENIAFTEPVFVAGIQFGDSIYCYDGMRFKADQLIPIPNESSLWLTNKSDSEVTTYYPCDNSTSTSTSSYGDIFEGFEYNGMVYKINGESDRYGIEVMPRHKLSDVERISSTDTIPLEYGSGKKIELADGTSIKIVPLKKGNHTVEFLNEYDSEGAYNTDTYVLYLYSQNEYSESEDCTILGNIKKTDKGYDISNAGFIYNVDGVFDTDGVINNNGKLRKNAIISNMNGRCLHYYSWCNNCPLLFEHFDSMSIGLNNSTHFSNFTSSSLSLNHTIDVFNRIFEKIKNQNK